MEIVSLHFEDACNNSLSRGDYAGVLNVVIHQMVDSAIPKPKLDLQEVKNKDFFL